MQHRALVRARGLGAFRRALVDRASNGSFADIRQRVVVVPTHAAGELLRQSCEGQLDGSARRTLVLPDFVTREGWLHRLHASMPDERTWLGRVDREVLFECAARKTIAARRRARPSFAVRPGIVGAMLDFYDALRRRQRTTRRFARVLFDELRVESGMDRGSENLLAQTCFLGFSFLAYERAVAAHGGMDEHVLRHELLASQPELPFTDVVVAVADHPSDPRGLWPADFDLLGRLRHVRRIDVVVTDEVHDAGFRDRLERELPGIVEERAADHASAPALVCPTDTALVSVHRDREDELREVARTIRAGADGDALSGNVAVVYRRPLPYLYMAQQVFTEARIPYQAFDALPLAAEPYAAIVDLLLAVGRTGGDRESTTGALRSTLLAFPVDGIPVRREEVAALERVLLDRRLAAPANRFVAAVDAFTRSSPEARRHPTAGARRAARAAEALAADVEPFRTGTRASEQVATIARVIRRHEAPNELARQSDRLVRARSAVLGVLDDLATAYREFDDERREPDALAATIHHALEARTFTPRLGGAGVHLVDAVAARFGQFDDVHVVGLVETDWPERSARNIFYAAPLLKSLGWPQDADQGRAELAAFQDIFTLADRTTRLSAFELEGDSVVALSPLVDTVRAERVVVSRVPEGQPIFTDELIGAGLRPVDLDEEPRAWLSLRHARPKTGERSYSGFVGSIPASSYRVSRVDRYVDCPFKYFAESVLRLGEERDEVAGLSPLERGTLLHSIFEAFYAEWQRGGNGAITPVRLGEAAELFARVATQALAHLDPADRVLEETRLLGSLVARGVAERVFELEADSPVAVKERWLERDLRGRFVFPLLGGLKPREIDIRGKADRVDVLEDGSLRVVDYKLGRMPDLDSSTQIAVYAHCARQLMEAEDGRPHPIAAATYLAFGEERRLEGRLGKAADATEAVQQRAEEFAKAVDAIEAGQFPPRPRRPGDCHWCGYAGVCRKEYLVEEEAEP